MGVYINMEMPKSCGKCKLFDLSHAIGLFAPLGFCRVCGKEIFCLSRIADACPLTEVPEPHGRLGDLDALIDKVIAKYLEHERKGELVFAAAEIKQDIVDLISDAPTIIPASEGS